MVAGHLAVVSTVGCIALVASFVAPVHSVFVERSAFDFTTKGSPSAYNTSQANSDGFTLETSGQVGNQLFRNGTVTLLSAFDSPTGAIFPSGNRLRYNTAAPTHERAMVDMEVVVYGNAWNGDQIVVSDGQGFTKTITFDTRTSWKAAKAADPKRRCDSSVPAYGAQNFPADTPTPTRCSREGEDESLAEFYSPPGTRSAVFRVNHVFNHTGTFNYYIQSATAPIALKSFKLFLGPAGGTITGACRNGCSGRGTCNVGDVSTNAFCQCAQGFSGAWCQNRICPNSCSGQGTCRPEDGTCTCNAGFGGSDCSIVNYQQQNPVKVQDPTYEYFINDDECYPQVQVVSWTGGSTNVSINVVVETPPGVPVKVVLLGAAAAKFNVVPGVPSTPPELLAVYRAPGSQPVTFNLAGVPTGSRWAQTAANVTAGLQLPSAYNGLVGISTFDAALQVKLDDIQNTNFEDIDSILFYNSGAAANVDVQSFQLASRPGVPACGTALCNLRGCCSKQTTTCSCIDPDWTSTDCATPVCVDNCNGNGQCGIDTSSGVEKPICNCDNGWSQAACNLAVCPDQNDCNRNGLCSGPNQCTCSQSFFGADCSCMVNCSTLSTELECQAGGCECPAGKNRIQVGNTWLCSDARGCNICGNRYCSCDECSGKEGCGYCDGSCRPGNEDNPSAYTCGDDWFYDTCEIEESGSAGGFQIGLLWSILAAIAVFFA